MTIALDPIGYVHAVRPHAEDNFWGGEEATITLVPGYEPSKVVAGARHPRHNTDWPLVGIFAQRGKNRPNRLGSTICRVLRCEGTTLVVTELDAIDGTPVLDIKPVLDEFLPREEVVQPQWSREPMRQYWLRKG